MAADIFKLLTRSSKLPKLDATDAPRIPSSSKPRPQLFGINRPVGTRTQNEPVERGHTQTPRGKKRKRKSVDVETIPTVLDFFGDAERQPEVILQAVTGESQHDDEEKEIGLGRDYAIGESTQTTEEDDRALLRSHKIKVHLLESQQAVGEDSNDETTHKMLKKAKRRRELGKDTDRRASKKVKTQMYPKPLRSFNELRSRYCISRRLAQNIAEQGYNLPTEVQMAALPILMDAKGENMTRRMSGQRSPDVLSVAPTGSGKTLAFMIPIMNSIMEKRSRHRNETLSEDTTPLAIIVAPTKELSAQITNEGRKLAAGTGIKIALLDKSMSLFDVRIFEESATTEAMQQVEADEKPHIGRVRSHILVCTPMTLVHAIEDLNGASRELPSVEHLVLDEADVLLDSLFREQTLAIWSACSNPALSISLWSATMGSSIEHVVQSVRRSRITSKAKVVASPLVRLVVGLKDTALPTISQRLVYAANEAGKLLAVRQLLHPTAPRASADRLTARDAPLRPPFLVFTQTIPRAIALASELRYDIPAAAGGSTRIAALHADLSDKQRDEVMTRFRRGDIWVLITTDLLARGVDFRGVNGVVNYDVPTSAAAYIHRVGRTGRAGREGGVAVTLYAEEDVSFVRAIANIIAASERGKQGGEDMTQLKMLLDTLPTPGRRERQRLKMRGVEARRPGNEGGRVRITTKSGYERKLENRRKDAIRAARSRDVAKRSGSASSGESDFDEFSS